MAGTVNPTRAEGTVHMLDQTPADMPYYVSQIHTTSRGLEASVRLGTAGPPGASLHTTVTLSPLDLEWTDLREQLEALLAKRAIEKINQMSRWARDHVS